jgi:cbb3-type cytochrome oxidase subunit 1
VSNEAHQDTKFTISQGRRKIMRGLAHFCFLSAALYAIVGMAGGIAMAATHDHSLVAAHAHLNLLGFVGFSIFGLYYHLVPSAAYSRLGRLHVVMASLGLWVLIPGVAMVNLGLPEGPAIIGSLVTILAMLVFVVVVAKNGRTFAN